MVNLRWNGDDFRTPQDSSGATAGKISRSGKLQQGYQHGSLTQGMVAYYPMDAGSGSTLDDQTELGNNGTLRPGSSGTTTTSGMWSSKAKIGSNCLSFDGVEDSGGDYVLVSDHPSLRFGKSDFCIAAWVKTRDTSDWSWMASKGNGSGNSSWRVGLSDTGNWIWRDRITDTDIESSSGPNSNEWNHFLVRRISGTIEIWINASEKVSGTASGDHSTTHDVGIGKAIGWDIDQWDGYIDDLRIYDRPLSNPEIQALYNLSSPSKVSPADTLQ